MWPFICIAVLRPGHFCGESKMSQFYLDHPLMLVRWNNEAEIAVLTFKSNITKYLSYCPLNSNDF